MNSERSCFPSSLNGKNNHPQRKGNDACRIPPRKIILDMTSNVELRTSNNAWKPGLKKWGATVDPETQKTEELLKTVRAILNKMTPEKFSRLMEQVHDLEITSEERLKGVVDLIFEKAIAEPSFTPIYAGMCSNLATLTVPMKEDPNSSVRFSRLLVKRCREVFHKEPECDVELRQKKKQLDSAESSTENRRLQEDLELAQTKDRKRSVGNIKFIGELFKQNMLAKPIMLSCIEKLLNISNEESLECLCQLLSTVGMSIDTRKSKPQMDDFFTEMESLITNRRTSSRMRFLLQDVVDLRSNNWVSRKTDQGPKTIQDIHKDARMEERDSLMNLKRRIPSRRRERQREQPMRQQREREVSTRQEIEREERKREEREREERKREEREREERKREEREREERKREERELEERAREVREREERERKEREQEDREREERERNDREREEREREDRELEERARKERERQEREQEDREREGREREEREREAFMKAEKAREEIERLHRQKRVGMRAVIERIERQYKVKQQRMIEQREQRVRELEERERAESERTRGERESRE